MATRDVGTQTPTSSSIIREETMEEGPDLRGYATASGIGAATALGAAPAVLGSIGFTAGGIVKATTAAKMMSVLGGGATPSGGIVATCQAVGAKGTAFVGPKAVLAVGGAGVVVAGAGYLAYKGIQKLREEPGPIRHGRRYKPSGRLTPTYINQRHQYSQTD